MDEVINMLLSAQIAVYIILAFIIYGILSIVGNSVARLWESYKR
jgi:hypothetical protein